MQPERVQCMCQAHRLSEGLQIELGQLFAPELLARPEAWQHTGFAMRRGDRVCMGYIAGTASEEDLAVAAKA